MTRSEGDEIASMVLAVVREVRRMQHSDPTFRGAPESTHIYVDVDVADVVYGRFSTGQGSQAVVMTPKAS